MDYVNTEASRVERMTWGELEAELQSLSNHTDLSEGLRKLEVYQEEVERQRHQLLEMQAVVEQSRDRYLELFESAPLGYLVLSHSGVVEEVNPACAELFQRSTDTLKGMSLLPLLKDGQCLVRHLRRLAEGEDPVRDEVWVRRPDGSEILVELFSRRAKRNGKYRTAVTDATARQEAERARRELSVSERVARESNEAKDRFIAMLSHELRTPLTPVITAIDMLRNSPEMPEKLQPLLERVRRNLRDEVHLIDDLLDLNRIRRGRLKLSVERVDIHTLIADVTASFAEDQSRIRLCLFAEHHWMWGDRVRVSQVIANLVRNALIASPDGGKVVITTETPLPGMVRITVKDGGKGIEPGDLDKIFEPFESGACPRGAAGHGLGLGLFIAKGLLEAHQGRIEAVSAGLGQGSCFVVDVPLDGTGARHQPTVREGRTSSPPPPTMPRRVLLVDDHVDTLETLSMLLELSGFQVSTASTVREASETPPDRFDILVTDLALPDGNGRELLASLRERRGVLPAIAISGFGGDGDLAASRAAGFYGHLTKPIDTERLLCLLGDLAESDAVSNLPQH